MEDLSPIQSFIYNTFGIVMPGYVPWIVIGILVLIALAFVAMGFVKELKKK